MKKVLSVLLCMLFVFTLVSCKNENPDVSNLSSEDVLTVYVWEMAEDAYYYGILEGKPEEHSAEEKIRFGIDGNTYFNADQVKKELEKYDYDSEHILVIPYQHPLSSYIPKIWIYDENGRLIQTEEEYISKQRNLLGL